MTCQFNGYKYQHYKLKKNVYNFKVQKEVYKITSGSKWTWRSASLLLQFVISEWITHLELCFRIVNQLVTSELFFLVDLFNFMDHNHTIKGKK